MTDLIIKQSSQAGPLGMMRIDIERVLGRLHAAAGLGPQDRYLGACARVQFWADLLTAGKLNGVLGETTLEELEAQLRSAECLAERAAHVMLGQEVAAFERPDYLAYASLALHANTPLDYLSKVLHLPMPECCGYDLADLTLINTDVEKLITQVRVDRTFLIVGIRTGGVYLAPLWKAVLTGLGASDVHWCTVRPLAGCKTSDDLETVRTWLEHQPASVVVVVDDRPDTGATMDRVAARLRNIGIDLWFSSIGKLWHDPEKYLIPIHPISYVTRDLHASRLWECLLPEDQPELIARLRGTPNIPLLPMQARVHFRCPHGEARYGSGCAWLPWSDPRVQNGRRPLVNPRKTPIEILGPDGDALLHLRFIGEGVFGCAEFERMRKIGLTDAAWLVDGYAITADIGVTCSFQEHFHTASQPIRADMLQQAANWLTFPERETIAHIHHSPVAMALGLRWSEIMKTMRELCGCDSLLEISEPLNAFLIAPVP